MQSDRSRLNLFPNTSSPALPSAVPHVSFVTSWVLKRLISSNLATLNRSRSIQRQNIATDPPHPPKKCNYTTKTELFSPLIRRHVSHLLSHWSGWWWRKREEAAALTPVAADHVHYKTTASGGRADLITAIKCRTVGGDSCEVVVLFGGGAGGVGGLLTGKWRVKWRAEVRFWNVCRCEWALNVFQSTEDIIKPSNKI